MIIHRSHGRSVICTVALCLFATLLGWPDTLGAEEATAVEAESSPSQQSGDGHDEQPSTAGVSAPSGPLSKLRVHGFLTQAFATGSFQEGRFPAADGSPAGPTPEELALGIPEDGTTDYRNMAIQFRYEMTPKDIMIVQLSSRALGDSPIGGTEDDIELDWALYERRLGDHTSLKVGRVLIPYGIFNEVRDVGTLLPFYRPAFVFYREGSYTTETVDGLLVSHAFFAESDWRLEANVYFGEWDLVEIDPFSETALPARSKDSFGSQFWLSTPVPGLRFGLGTQRRNVSGGAEGIVRTPGAANRFDEWLASVDAVFEKWVARAEYRVFENDAAVFPAFGVDDFVARFPSYYAQLGFHPTQKFRVYLQAEVSEFDVRTALFTEPQEFTEREDFGIAFNYLFGPAVVLKAEYHQVSGKDQGFLPVFTPAGFQLQPIFSDLDDGDYTIISLSASF